jgi:bacillithiol biosynthesis cysteine-adding enzyme BshC
LAYSYSRVSYNETGFFSRLVTDFLAGSANVNEFYSFSPDAEGIDKAINARSLHLTDRQLLVQALTAQYQGRATSSLVIDNIQSLLNNDTYTVTTAHQPNLMTGYLYFVYKILHVIKLADELNAKYTNKHFVPVYYMGSEDNDIDELGVFRYGNEKYVWDGDGQKGAVGRMSTAGLKPILERLFATMGPPGIYYTEMRELITEAYMGQPTLGAATHYLVDKLFGKYGLVIVNPDDALLKSVFIPVIKDELLHSNSFPIVIEQTRLLEQNYKTQAFPRPINLFYLAHQIRERIERNGEKWVVLNTDISFTEAELIQEVSNHPERFSPNVILRGLFQSTILPDVAFIGGGAEVAYWFQLKTLFEYYGVFYPLVMLRQSVLWIDTQQARLRQQSGLQMPEIFKKEADLTKYHITAHSQDDWHTTAEAQEIAGILDVLRSKAVAVDPTLLAAANAVLHRIQKQLTLLEQKMYRAEKKKMSVQLQRITKLKEAIFPDNSLQERTFNFVDYYLLYGTDFFDIVKDGIEPLSNKFLVVEQESV